MTALIDVVRPIGGLLSRRPGPSPHSGGCPAWCRLAPGHPFLAETADGPRFRYHESGPLTVGLPDDGARLEARLVVDEVCTPSGECSLTEPRIVLDGMPAQWPSLGPDETGALAELLRTVASALGGSARRAA